MKPYLVIAFFLVTGVPAVRLVLRVMEPAPQRARRLMRRGAKLDVSQAVKAGGRWA